jgi:hypothetical protein
MATTRWMWQFSLKSLFVVVTTCAIVVGVVAQWYRWHEAHERALAQRRQEIIAKGEEARMFAGVTIGNYHLVWEGATPRHCLFLMQSSFSLPHDERIKLVVATRGYDGLDTRVIQMAWGDVVNVEVLTDGSKDILVITSENLWRSGAVDSMRVEIGNNGLCINDVDGRGVSGGAP